MLLLAVTALLFGAPGANASVDQVRGGQSALFVPFADVVTLAQKGISISPISPAFLTFNSFQEGPALRFPVSGGTVESDTMVGTVNHAGGMLIQKIDPQTDTVTHEMSVINLRILNGNMLVGDALELLPAPTADLINATWSKDPVTGVIHYEADAQTSAATALVLNTYFETDAFVGGSILGRLKSDINTLAHVRPQGATPMRVSLVPAYVPCAAPDRVHGPPLDSPSCASPTQRSTELTVGTPDANGRASSSTGSVQMRVVAGNPNTTEDEADVRLVADITDVPARLGPGGLRRRARGSHHPAPHRPPERLWSDRELHAHGHAVRVHGAMHGHGGDRDRIGMLGRHDGGRARSRHHRRGCAGGLPARSGDGRRRRPGRGSRDRAQRNLCSAGHFRSLTSRSVENPRNG